MKAAVWYGGKEIKIENVPKPTILADEILVRVRAASICGSELHAYSGVSKRRVPPLIMGHEFSGEVAEVGKRVVNIKVGDRVSVDPLIRCGVCEQCTKGRGNICYNAILLGLHKSGAFAEYIAVPAMNCYRLPEHLSFEEGSTVEPLAVGVHSIIRAPVNVGDSVAVIGSGTIGLGILQANKIAGAIETIVIDIVDYRLEYAKKLGAGVTIHSKNEDPVKRVMELTDNNGVDVAFEAVGLQLTVQQALAVTKTGGKVIVAGMMAEMMEIDILNTVAKEKEIKGTYGYTSKDYRTALNLLIKGVAEVKSMVTHVYSLDDVSEAFNLLHEKGRGVIKVVLRI
jgi:2-desacetyl-2-hydroxyethyl bacteriochlorophyllide A dehydrogenase